MIKNAWGWLVNWFETGDLVPLLVLVSAVHYADVLRGKDVLAVAVAIGLLVDLGHYRTVRAAVRYGGDDRRQMITRWTIALVLTGLSLNYHQRFYDDWWLSVPLPLLIAALAWLQRVDQRTGTRSKVEPTKAPVDIPLAVVPIPLTAVEVNEYSCQQCGYGTDNQRKYAGHMSAHKRQHPNGQRGG